MSWYSEASFDKSLLVLRSEFGDIPVTKTHEQNGARSQSFFHVARTFSLASKFPAAVWIRIIIALALAISTENVCINRVSKIYLIFHVELKSSSPQSEKEPSDQIIISPFIDGDCNIQVSLLM